MANLPPGDTVVEEAVGASYTPTPQEVREQAAWFGLDPDADGEMMSLVRDNLKTPLPPHWKTVRKQDGQLYYCNIATGERSWDHPVDQVGALRRA